MESKQSPGYFFLDLETGGLKPHLHPILQVAAIRTDMQFNIQASFRTYIKPAPGLEITEEALRTNGLDPRILANAPDERLVGTALYHFIAMVPGCRFAGYRCEFDLGFLDEWRKRIGVDAWAYGLPWFDLLPEARKKLPRLMNHKLVTVAEHYGFDTGGAHDAAKDILMTVQIARQLCPPKVKVPA